ncbi:ATP-dependent nuclease [Legionella feeleii]|uniref:Predicted ATPase n=1 Tax=Legionella feeleii TaxID=453 RepID=A0A0W0TXF0_9GAMM|nr:AAA family ATPase [Legionella feeleii]KTD00086.1 hypothetical protein Lfee_1293 [Legionella feeleii]SPX62782.1 Predicted ATPase [Legionella feeleii]
MAVNIKLTSLKFNDGSIIPLAENSTTVIVGPNNVGKSCTLRETYNILKNGLQQAAGLNKVITNITFEQLGTAHEFDTYLNEKTTSFIDDNGNVFRRSLQTNIHQTQSQNMWNNIQQNGLRELLNVFVTFADTANRLNIILPPDTYDRMNEIPQHPIQMFLDNDTNEEKLSRYVKQAFGEDLILNWGAGKKLPLHIGTKPNFDGKEDRVSSSYVKKLLTVPLAHEQGDGIKSFLGCLLSTIILDKPITLLDEPEAFLHPPQARLLGTLLANEHQAKQLIIATHSGDVLRGILDTNIQNLTVIRINRDGKINTPSILEPRDIKEFWNDTLLRHSNVLDGLFHESVIICESDADCRFYSALLSSIHEKENSTTDSPNKKPDTLFIPAGGNARIAKISTALNKIKVKTFAIIDFDTLQNRDGLKKLYKNFGGNWDDIKDSYNAVKEQIDKMEPPATVEETCNNIEKIISEMRLAKSITNKQQQQINGFLRATKGWSKAKNLGLNILSTDEATLTQAKLLLEKLKEFNIWVVPYGELESFDTSINEHGPNWVNEALDKGLVDDPTKLSNARSFMSELMKKL